MLGTQPHESQVGEFIRSIMITLSIEPRIQVMTSLTGTGTVISQVLNAETMTTLLASSSFDMSDHQKVLVIAPAKLLCRSLLKVSFETSSRI